MATSRQKCVDALKGVMAICVVLGHVTDGYLKSATWPEYQGLLFALYNIIYSFHMPLCFMISGYLYQLAYIDVDSRLKKERMQNHLVDFLIIYCVFSVLFWFTKLLMADSVNNTVGVKDIFFIWVDPLPTFWYLYVLIALYLLFSIRKLRRIKAETALIIFALVNVVSNFIPWRNWFQIQNIARYALFFYLGMLRRENRDFILFKRKQNLMGFAIAIICFVPFLLNGYRISSTPILNTIVAFGISNVLWLVFESYAKNARALCICGINMLEIYITHVFIVAAFRILFIKLGISLIWICVPLNVLLGTALPVLFSEVAKKLGLHDMLFRPYSSHKTAKLQQGSK